MAKAKFERSKPHVNIGTIGHVDHGKPLLPQLSPNTSPSAEEITNSSLMTRSTTLPRKKQEV